MQPSDRVEFDAQIRTLCAVCDKPSTDERLDGFWRGLAKMSLIQLARLVDAIATGEVRLDRLTPPALWDAHHKLRAPAVHTTAPSRVDTAPHSKWLQLTNGLFLKYLLRRRLTENAKHDLNLEERRAECLELATWYDGLEAEGLEPTERELIEAFNKTMARVQDAPQDQAA